MTCQKCRLKFLNCAKICLKISTKMNTFFAKFLLPQVTLFVMLSAFGLYLSSTRQVPTATARMVKDTQADGQTDTYHGVTSHKWEVHSYAHDFTDNHFKSAEPAMNKRGVVPWILSVISTYTNICTHYIQMGHNKSKASIQQSLCAHNMNQTQCVKTI